jgi:hypothetical protein
MQVIYYDDNGDELTAELPSHMMVCDRCQGHGTHLNPSIGEYAYSREEFEESFDEEERGEYFRRGGRYDVQCETCKGLRVVEVVDQRACRTPEQKADFKAYTDYLEEKGRSEAEDRATMRGEMGWQG